MRKFVIAVQRSMQQVLGCSATLTVFDKQGIKGTFDLPQPSFIHTMKQQRSPLCGTTHAISGTRKTAELESLDDTFWYCMHLTKLWQASAVFDCVHTSACTFA